MYQAALFDLDGTIADSLQSLSYVTNKVMEECGLKQLETERFRYFAGDGAKTLVERALKEAGDPELKKFETAFEKYEQYFAKDCNYKVKAFDGMLEVLRKMKEKGIKLGVVTNKAQKNAELVVEELYGKGLFDVIVGYTLERPRKPDPAEAVYAMECLGVKPEETIYIGDTNVDMKTGNGAGCDTVGVLWGFRTREELEANHAKIIIEKVEQLLELLD